MIFGSRWVGGARHPLLVVLTVADSYDNLPIVRGRSFGAGLFRTGIPPRGNPELLRFEPLMAVFSQDLQRLYESGGEIPPPSPSTRAALDQRGRAWATDQLGGGEAFILYFKGPQEVFALAHLHPSRTALLASYLRLFLLNAFLREQVNVIQDVDVFIFTGKDYLELAELGDVYLFSGDGKDTDVYLNIFVGEE
ncbi:MAG: hypothetical protein AAB249_04365, partial [Acidobacteriota bacterium]